MNQNSSMCRTILSLEQQTAKHTFMHVSLYLSLWLKINAGSGECGFNPCITGFIQYGSTGDLVLHSFGNGLLMCTCRALMGYCFVYPPHIPPSFLRCCLIMDPQSRQTCANSETHKHGHTHGLLHPMRLQTHTSAAVWLSPPGDVSW